MTRRDFIWQLTASGLYSMTQSVNILETNPAGVVVRPSPYSVNETAERLAAGIRRQGGTIYTQIDQQAELQKVGQPIPPLLFILFGNPKGGGPIMAENPLAALDLPLKLIVWEDQQKKVSVAYNTNTYIGDRYGLSPAAVLPLRLDGLITEALTS